MGYSPVSYFVAGIAAVAGVALFTGRWKPTVFGAAQLGAAQLEEMQIEIQTAEIHLDGLPSRALSVTSAESLTKSENKSPLNAT